MASKRVPPLSWAQRALLLALAAYRLAALCGALHFLGAPFLLRLASLKTLRVLSYLALLIEFLAALVGAAGVFSRRALTFYVLYALPLALETALAVAFLICAVVWANEQVYTNALACYHETNRVATHGAYAAMEFGALHTRDFVVHSWPALEQLALLLALHQHVRRRVAQHCAHARARLFYLAYIVGAATLVLAFYGFLEDWKRHYGVPPSSAVGTTMAIGIGLACGLFYALNVWPRAPGRSVPAAAPNCDRAEWTTRLAGVRLDV